MASLRPLLRRGVIPCTLTPLHLRPLSTAPSFVPPPSAISAPTAPRPTPKPASPYYYTARPSLSSALSNLSSLLTRSQRALGQALALPAHKLPVTPPPTALRWVPQADLAARLDGHLRLGPYKALTGMLTELAKLLPLARAAGHATADIVAEIEAALDEYSPPGGHERVLPQRKPVQFDLYGRSYTVGRRKTSSARVWMIPTKPSSPSPSSSSSSASSSSSSDLPTTTEVLVNARPIAEVFPRASDREAILYPLRIAGQLGAFHVFALVRGGGVSGQAAAIAHAIAKGLVGHIDQKQELGPDEGVKRVLKKAGVLLRDPRMVERKKTGLAKARKRYTWVKR